MLSPELDVLRNKELSFWCVAMYINLKFHVRDEIITVYNVDNTENWIVDIIEIMSGHTYKNVYTSKEISNNNWSDDNYIYNIIWHPLTRWRIEYLVTNHKASPDENKDLLYRICINKILDIFTFNNKLFDKTELERMQYDKRNELYPLLVEFSTYFKHE